MNYLPFWKKSAKSTLEKATAVNKVAIFGYADAKPGDKLYQETFEVTKLLAQTGYIVVDGGGPGVMQAASKGAKAGGGKVIGVTLYPKEETHFEGRDKDNPIDKEIKTTSYVERTLTLMKEGQIYVIFNGATGTMSEFAMAWGLARLYFGHHRPLILYGKFWEKIMKVLQENLLLRPEESRVYKIVHNPQEVLSAILLFEKEIAQGKHHNLKIGSEEKNII